ncbi:MAG: hypothetical protein ACH0QD_13220 [Tepidibacillus sp.]
MNNYLQQKMNNGSSNKEETTNYQQPPMITLAEAIPLKSAIVTRIKDLRGERELASTIVLSKGEQYTTPERNVDLITNEIEEAQMDLVQLDYLITKANTENVIEWNGTTTTLVTALELARQKREELQYLKVLGNKKKHDKRRFLNEAADLTIVTLYEPEEYRQKALKLERQLRKLSSLIEHTNHFITIPFDASKYMD